MLDPSAGAATINVGSGNAAGSTVAQDKPYFEQIKDRFNALTMRQKFGLGGAIAFLFAVLLAVSISADNKSTYKVLFSNLNDPDAAAIVASLQQLNVPYKFSEGGGALMVPERNVYETRLKLAGQGLPKSGSVGFELLENQKLGTSQFVEQVNYQRALEGELAKSISSIAQIKSARVFLAVPKQSAFVRDQEKPTASVVLTMYPGRFLDTPQVIAIEHLVSSSVPRLAPQQVSVVDQDGNLLSKLPQNTDSLDSAQLKYVSELENALSKRISNLLEPVAGKDSVRAQVTLDINFDERTRTEETFGKNSAPNQASIRSQQNSESSGQQATIKGAVPGALTNQPPAQPTAPLTGPLAADNEAQQLISPSSNNPNGSSERRDSTINYEVDRAIEYLKANKGQLKRVSAAVVVNYKNPVITNGEITTPAAPYTPEEMEKINSIVRDAVGYVEKRGDTVTVANIPFNQEPTEVIPFYKQPNLIELVKEFFKYGVLLAAIYLVYRALMKTILLPKPVKEDIVEPVVEIPVEETPMDRAQRERIEREEAEALRLAEIEREKVLEQKYAELSEYTENFVKSNPQVLASLVNNWRTPKKSSTDGLSVGANPIAEGGA
jgi:flagellar M-ring protein FliF